MGCGSSRSADPFVLAAEGSISALAQWLDNGGSVDAVDGLKGRGSLLQVAARHDRVECLKLLLKCGASVNLATPDHGTALHAAASAGASNAVPLLLANGADTAARLQGRTAAELAERQGFPATANLIRMTEPDPSVRGRGAGDTAAAAERGGSGGLPQAAPRGSGSIHPRERALAAQQATAAKLRDIEKQLSEMGSEQQSAVLEGQLGGSGVLPSPSSRPRSPHPQQPWRPSPGSSLRSASSGGAASAAAGSRQASTQLPPAPQGGAVPQPGGLSDKELQELVDRAQQRASQAARQHSGAAEAGAAAPKPDGQGGGGGSFTAPRSAPSPPLIDSRKSLPGEEAESEESGSSNSSARNSLVNDPLLEFVRRAMLSRQPSSLSNASPFAAAAALPPPDGPAAGGQRAQQPPPPEQQQQQQGGGVGTAAPSTTAAPPPLLPQPVAALPGAPSGAAPAGRTSSSDLLGGGRPSGGASTQQPPRGSGSMSFSVDIKPWEIDFEDLALQKTIGEGSFGKVYVAKWHETLVAVKVLLDVEEAQQAAGPEAAWTLSNPILFNLQKECGLMASLRHPNVVQFMGVSAIPPAMITEYCAKGSLADVLKAGAASAQKAAQLTWLRRLNMALDATKGMLYLHKRGIIHRDLKSPNLLVESTWKVKVADFNLSKIVEDTGSGRSTIANMNPRWLAPEILNGESATTASDVFSWGVVMWELLTFKLPWPHVSPWGLVGKLMDGLRLRIPPREELPGPDNDRFVCLEEYLELMQRCWAQAPEDRPNFEEVIHDLRKMLEVQARAMEK